MKLELGDIRSEPARAIDPRRYHEAADPKRPPIAERLPVCLYLEVTNRCNLLCTTCPRTYEALEPPADMSWDLFTGIVDQVPDLARAVLHGIGEPMLVKSLPLMVRHLKERGVYVLFNTNGTALNERNGRALIEAGLDELRVSSTPRPAKAFAPCAASTSSTEFCATSAGFATCRGAKAPLRPVSRCGSPASRKRWPNCRPLCASPGTWA